MVVRKVGKYEIGRTIGEGTFAKVKFAQNTESGESVAMKVLDRSTIIKHKMVDQIKREISIMKLVRHPYVVRLHEVLASRTKIYIILEFITGGELFDKIINKAEFSCPSWFPVGAKSLINQILDPNPEIRITIEQIRNDEWFQRGYVPVSLQEYEEVNLDDINAAFDEEQRANQQCENEDMGPLLLNAFDLIILSQGLNLASIFDRGQDSVKYQTRFVSQKPAKVVLSSMEVVAQSMGFKTHIRNYKMRIEGTSANKTFFSVILEIFEVAPTFYVMDIQKAAGDAGEYLKFYKNFCSNLEDIIWHPPHESSKSRISKTKSKRR